MSFTSPNLQCCQLFLSPRGSWYSLHLVLDRSDRDALLKSTTSLDVVLCELNKSISELVIDLLVHINSFAKHTDLSRVHECHDGNLGNTLIKVHIVAHDGSVVASKLQNIALQRLSTAFCHFLARGD